VWRARRGSLGLPPADGWRARRPDPAVQAPSRAGGLGAEAPTPQPRLLGLAQLLACAGAAESAHRRSLTAPGPTSRSSSPEGRPLGLGGETRSIPWPICPDTGSCFWVPGLACRAARRSPGTMRAGSVRGSGSREPQYVPGPWPSRAAQMVNDLETPIARHHPRFDQMRMALRRRGPWPRPCPGAGSNRVRTLSEAEDAVAAVERLSGSGWRVVLTESLGRGDTHGRAAAGAQTER